MKLLRNTGWCIAAVLVTVGLIGCAESQKPSNSHKHIEGVAKVIDLENNIVSMTCKDEKGAERELKGSIRPDTEVFINGRSHALKDVRVGDQVVVEGYREGEGNNQKLIATKVEVKRPQEADWKTTGPSTAKPPEPARPVSDKPPTPAQPANPPTPPRTPTAPPPSAATPPAPPPAAPKSPEEQEKMREQMTDMIYARVRVEMEAKIAKRAELLKAGRDPSDPEIRNLEGSIMQARKLLLEAGEIVPDIQPPIVQPAAPKPEEPKPATPPAPKG